MLSSNADCVLLEQIAGGPIIGALPVMAIALVIGLAAGLLVARTTLESGKFAR